MNNIEKYNNAFANTFMIETQKLPGLKYQAIDTWDSVGHMALMAVLEESFAIELDIDDIIGFSSYEVGLEILSKYKVVFE
jgi:acyl carrier protein